MLIVFLSFFRGFVSISIIHNTGWFIVISGFSGGTSGEVLGVFRGDLGVV